MKTVGGEEIKNVCTFEDGTTFGEVGGKRMRWIGTKLFTAHSYDVDFVRQSVSPFDIQEPN